MPRGDRGGTSKGSGVRCVAANCGNTNADGFSLHSFPKDPTLRRKWADFVKAKRANWSGPTEFSAICSFHFTPECFPFRHRFEIEHMGRAPKKAKLNSDAVPSIHSVNRDATTVTGTDETASTPTQRCSGLHMLSPSEETTLQSSPPKKIRRVYAKRETARIIAAHDEQAGLNKSTNSETTELHSPERSPSPNHIDCEKADEFEVDMMRPMTTTIGCQVNKRPKQRSKYCQTSTRKPEAKSRKSTVKMKTIAVQTDCTSFPVKPAMKDAFQLVRPEYLDKVVTSNKKMEIGESRNSASIDDDPLSSPMKDDPSDPTYEPNSPNSEEENTVDIQTREIPVEEQLKFLVFESNLMELFNVCRICGATTVGDIAYLNGSMVKVRQECKMCMHIRYWFSQPFVGCKPAGNLLVSAGILFSGSVPSKTLRMYKFMNISCISMSTYMNHQKFYLYPAIGHVWGNYQRDYISDVSAQNKSVVLGGDGRADTPGHSAKFGSYTMLDLDEGVVVDVQLGQSNEVKSSCHMEKEGLIRSTNFFKDHNIPINTLVTDRHVQIVKWVRENLTDTTHCFDVWHVAKGMKKKLLALSKEKDCSDLTPWIKSLVNHLYWTAATSGDQNKELIMAKWQSVANHVINIHSGHSDVFPSCQHGDLEGRERQKKWLKPGTKVFEKLEVLISSRQMKRDIPMLSSNKQTSALEGYHSVINHFAPKMIGFSHHGMLCRLWLAALHFNENSQRDQARTLDGQLRYRIIYPKYKKGGYSVRKVLVNCTYDYVDCLMKTAFRIGEVVHMNDDAVQLPVHVPPPLCSQYERPDKAVAVQNLVSRFNPCQPHGSQCSSGSDQGM